MIDLPRSNYYYYRSTASEHGLPNARLVDLIDDVHEEFPGNGHRRVTRELCARGYPVNHKRTARVQALHPLVCSQQRRMTKAEPACVQAYLNVPPADRPR